MKWKKPTRSVMPRHEASTASRPRPKVSARTMMVRPSSARKKSMPSGAIQGTLTCASQAPSTRPAAPGPRAANAARRVPALASHWPTSRASGAAVPTTAVQRASPGRARPSSQAPGAAAAGIRMYQSRITAASPEHHDGQDEDDAYAGDRQVGAEQAVLRGAERPPGAQVEPGDPADGGLDQVAAGDACEPLHRAHEDPLVEPVEAPAVQPERLDRPRHGLGGEARRRGLPAQPQQVRDLDAHEHDDDREQSGAGALGERAAAELRRRQRRAEERLQRVEAAEPARHPYQTAYHGEHAKHIEGQPLAPAGPARHRRVLLAEEDDEDQAEGVQGGDEGAGQGAEVEPHAAVDGAQARGDDEVLAVEAGGDERKGRQRRGADGEDPEDGRHLAAQATHPEDVVLVGERLDDHPGAEEEQGLEEGVGHEVEDGRLPAAHAQRQEHVADLADGGVGKHALDVVLRQGAEAGVQQGGRADDGDREAYIRGELVEDVRAGDEVHASGDHGGGVDQRADRRRAGHGVGQPGLQRELRRLGDGAAEEQGGRGNGEAGAGRPVRGGTLHQRLDLERVELREQQEEPDDKGRVADARDDERLAPGVDVLNVLLPVRDEQVAAESDALPANVQQQQVVGQHQHEHRGDEQVHVDEEAGEALVALHVLGRVEVDEEADEGDYEDEDEAHGVEVEGDLWLQPGDVEPGPEDLAVGVAGRRRGDERRRHQQRHERREADGAGADHRRAVAAQAPAAEHQHDEAGGGQRRYEPQQPEHHQPLISSASSTSSERSVCRKRMAIASPTATSAAAMARTKRNMTWPSGRPQRAPATTNARPAALSMISMQASTTMRLRRTSRPAKPMPKSTAASRSP